MKNKLKLLAIVSILAIASMMTACSKDDDKFDYPMEDVYGTWKLTKVKIDNTYQNWILTPTSMSFYKDGSYYGKGYFGNGWGTYTAKGNKITTYIDGKEYFTYIITSLNGNVAYVSMGTSKSENTLDVICEKQ